MSHTEKIRCGPQPKPLFWLNTTNNPIIIKTHKRFKPINENKLLLGRHYLVDLLNNLHKCPGCPSGTIRNGSCIIYFNTSTLSSLWVSNTNSNNSKYRFNNLITELLDINHQNEPILQPIIIRQP